MLKSKSILWIWQSITYAKIFLKLYVSQEGLTDIIFICSCKNYYII